MFAWPAEATESAFHSEKRNESISAENRFQERHGSRTYDDGKRNARIKNDTLHP